MTEPASLPRPRQVTLAACLIMGGSRARRGVRLRGGRRPQRPRDPAGHRALPRPSRAAPGSTSTCRACSPSSGCSRWWPPAARPRPRSSASTCSRATGAPGSAITLLAVPLFVSGLVAGGFLSSLVAASAVMLWLEPSRDWFDGKPAKTPAGARAPHARASGPAACRRPRRDGPATPRGLRLGARRRPGPARPAQPQPRPPSSSQGTAARRAPPRPDAVLWAVHPHLGVLRDRRPDHGGARARGGRQPRGVLRRAAQPRAGAGPGRAHRQRPHGRHLRHGRASRWSGPPSRPCWPSCSSTGWRGPGSRWPSAPPARAPCACSRRRSRWSWWRRSSGCAVTFGLLLRREVQAWTAAP